MASVVSRQALLRLSVRPPQFVNRVNNRAAVAASPQKYGHGRAFSSTVRAPAVGQHQQQHQLGRNGGVSAGDGVEIPAFSLKQLGLNPRMRYAIVALLLTAGFIEGAAWVYFWPRVFGNSEEAKEDKQSAGR
ncbi:hypothetical protein MAPG_07529 [Magnaporthiopsis poae ATCC 64411]|uniref:Uncharacterized protein n=1 Tax=Magnaporthiopsis poae (strain ATCC 64411 / 73-15) TaxID=644358 RepID=A0A0C4E4X5_MAGP6|nr:hypothetical protein MAPG_07529 [Magnaporthiopsis poae ATCC 64411]